MIERPAKLTIRAIQAVPLVAPLRRVFRGSNYQMTKRCTVITRVVTTEGVIGESYNGDEEGEAQVRLVRTITERLAPLLAGRDATMVESCWQDMLPITYDILGDRARGRRRRLRADGRRDPGLLARRRQALLSAYRRPQPPVVRGAVPLVQRPARDAGPAARNGRAGRGGSERAVARGRARSDGRGGGRRGRF